MAALYAHAAKLTPAKLRALLAHVDTVVLDCDGTIRAPPLALMRVLGVLWRGTEVIAGVPEALALLRTLVR